MNVRSLQFLPSVNSTDAQWIEFHKQLKKEVGKANANILFINAFESRQGSTGLLGSKSNTSSLREYMSKEGVDISANGALYFVSNTIDDVSGFIEGAFKIGSTTFVIIALVVLIPIFIFLLNVAKKPEMIAGALKPL